MGLFFVAGEVGGEAVSRTAIEVVHAAVEVDSVGDACVGAMAAPQCRDEVRLMMSPRRTNHRRLSDDGPEQPRSSVPASFAGVLLAPGAAYMAYVGDMCVYRFRCGKLEERTRGHARPDDGASYGTISTDALALLSQHAHTAIRALGCEAAVEMKGLVERTEPGDIFLVCSGGLWRAVPEARIAGILAAHHELRLAASLLMDCAHEHGEPENVICILARVGDS
ncbi:PP2C family protein-serine/threonine phosphatase [Sorangium sp. So ce341]|uniref:PP2C family protein-serine/threonine phosphatase n=1 Tax=Sorangium sp. So ce341 TaxID=3133302 RepID=UPI003F617B24